MPDSGIDFSYNITTGGAKRVYNKVKYLAEHCDETYAYQTFTHNCILFTADMYTEAGLGNKSALSDIYDMP